MIELFGTVHLVTLLVIFLCGAVLILAHRRGQGWALTLLAWSCLSVYAVNQAAFATVDFAVPWDNLLPFHLCDVAAVVAGLALLTRKRTLCELAYFWGLAGTLQGLISPNTPFGWTHPVFWSFFFHHGMVVIAALFLPLALGWRPNRSSIWRVFLWGQVYFCFALIVNKIMGTNFGFLSEKPASASLLDHLGDWPIYLIWLQVVALVFYFILWLPFCFRGRSGMKK